MKSTKTDKSSEPEYPCLMIHKDGGIVLFYNRFGGTVVNRVEPILGYHRSDWVMGDFTPYTGKVTLENGE